MTSPILIDFARAPDNSPTLFGRVALSMSAGVFLCLLTLVFSWQLYQKHLEIHQAQHQLASITQKRVLQRSEIKSSPVKQAEQTGINKNITLSPIFDAIQRPWESLLDTLAESTPASVVLLTVIPSASKQSLSLEGEASNFPSLFTYVEHLQALPQIEQLHLKQHAQITEGEYRPIHFLIEAEWKP